MIRVGDLTLFQELEAGSLLPFAADRARTVRLTFNAPQRTVINVVPMHPDGTFPEEDPFFLAIVEGLQEVEFYALGSFAIQAEADRVWVKTADGKPIHAVVPDAQTFTRIVERRVRNPEIEAMQAMLLRNQERRMGAAFEQLRREREALYAEREALNSGTGATGGNSPAPESPAGTGQPAGGATPPASGAEGAPGEANGS